MYILFNGMVLCIKLGYFICILFFSNEGIRLNYVYFNAIDENRYRFHLLFFSSGGGYYHWIFLIVKCFISFLVSSLLHMS